MIARDREQPVRERVQPRERHVRRADHQRDHVVADPGEGGDHEQEDHQRRMHREQAVEGLVVDELHPRLGELGAHEHGQQAGDDEEDDRRDQVLDPDHLVVGVDPEVVAPAVRAVTGVVLRHGRLAARVARPVVEAAEADEEADRHGRERHGREDRAVPDRVPAFGPADENDEAGADPEEQRDRPRHAEPPGGGQPMPAARGWSGSVMLGLRLVLVEADDGLAHCEPPARY